MSTKFHPPTSPMLRAAVGGLRRPQKGWPTTTRSNGNLPTAPEHLNSTGCEIKYSPGKGRGVFASREIHSETVVEVSPALLFTKDEYEQYGQHTILNEYTFKWPDGRMALALGLGSLFNHSTTPNTSFLIDTKAECIRFKAVRKVAPGEELCIFYGHKLWFQPAEGTDAGLEIDTSGEDEVLGGLAILGDYDLSNPFAAGNDVEVMEARDWPFTRIKPPPEEEEMKTIRTTRAWVVDVPNALHIATMLRWLKQTGLDTQELGHLKRIRKNGHMSTLLLTTSETAPILPEGLDLPQPYKVTVPKSSALTPRSLELKTSLWPTVFTPRRKDGEEVWTRAKARWAWEAMQIAIQAAMKASFKGEIGIGVHVPAPFEVPSKVGPLSPSYTAYDTRRSTKHPLRHAITNVIKKVANHASSEASPSTSSTGRENAVFNSNNVPGATSNAGHYLLTGLTLFITHEPCIMCSMALLHSRVKEVIYLYSMQSTGGCGSVVCLPTLPGVNHRFGISKWKEAEFPTHSEDLSLKQDLDA